MNKKWFNIYGYHTKGYNETLRYLESDLGLHVIKNVEKYYQLYIKPYHLKSTPIPDFNPLDKYEFKLTKSDRDINIMSGKLDKHLILSARAYKIFQEYNISPHVAFGGIVFRNEDEIRDDYYYIHFYKSMWDDVDIKSSTFMYVDKVSNPSIIIDTKFSSLEDYNYAKNHRHDKGYVLRKKEIVITNISEYDFFAIFDESDFLGSYYCSNDFYKRLKSEKIKFEDSNELKVYSIVDVPTI